MNLASVLKPGANLCGVMEGTVLDREDPNNQGRVGVFIPRVMGLIPNSATKSTDMLQVTPTSERDDINSVAGVATIKGINYLWAKRASRTGENFGEWTIPPVGAVVFVFFLDGDPTQLYYLPFGPGDRNKIPSKAKNPDDVVIQETIHGSKIGFTGGDEEEFYIELPDGSGIKIVPKDQEILMMTKDSSAKVSMKNDTITVIATNVILEGTDITLKTVDGMLWKPNIVPNCPLGGFPHGGPAGGINHIKGAAKGAG